MGSHGVLLEFGNAAITDAAIYCAFVAAGAACSSIFSSFGDHWGKESAFVNAVV